MKWSIPERIVEQGREYMQEGRVLSIVQNPEKRIWLSEVLGEELYLVELDGTAKEQDVCECQYWMEHGYCKHTVAVELALKQQACQELFKRIKQSVLRKQIDQQLKCLQRLCQIKQSFCRSSLAAFTFRISFRCDRNE